MSSFAKPRLIISKCLGFAPCRHDGAVIKDGFVGQLRKFAEVTTVCPEEEIGLGTPRDPLRLVRLQGRDRMVQPKTGLDVTSRMERFTRGFLRSVEEPDGVILKNRSPSCGLTDAKIYPPGEKVPCLERGAGLFGRAARERFERIPCVDEGRLKNFVLREHFYAAVFAFAAFRKVRSRPSMGKIVDFHSNHKLLLMAHSEAQLRIMGKLVANAGGLSPAVVVTRYEEHLRKALSRAARFTSNINVLMHALGHFSRDLTSREKAHFLDLLESYRAGKIPLSGPVTLLRSLILRFEEPYLSRQTFFEPFPQELVEITDSGKGRDA